MSAPVVRSDASSFERVVEALSDRVTRLHDQRRHADARCPAHDDHNPSLSVDWKNNPSKGGVTVLKCHAAGCDARDILAAIGLSLSDTYDTEPHGQGSGTSPSPRAGSSTPARSTTNSRRSSSTLGSLEEEYPYCTADGTVVGWMRRYEGKQFRWQRISETGRRVNGQPKPCPLFLLPSVVDAVADGVEVHLAEGEKDALALVDAGVTATTVPNGATVTQTGQPKNLSDEHLDTLHGAHVVIWADCDGPDPKSPERGYQGYRHAMHVRDRLAGYAASVRVVEAVEGKDAADHLAAGHAAGDAATISPEDPVPDEILARWTASAPASVSNASEAISTDNVVAFPRSSKYGGGGGGSDAGKQEIYVRDEFELYNGALVKRKETRDSITRTELLNAEARMVRQVVRDLGPGVDAEPMVDIELSKNGETHTLRSLPRKEFEDPTKWAGKVPLPLVFPRGHSKGQVANAIIQVSGAIPVETAYGLLGWREIRPDEWAYLHAGGAIGKDGALLGTRVEVSPRLRGFTLPAEVPEGDELRRSYDSVMAIADKLPHHIAYPLIAAGCRAVLGSCRVPVTLVGSTGTYKSATAALIQQMYMPSARYDKLPAGLGEESSTGGGLEQLMHEAGHAVLTVDDSAPDRGTARAAARLASLMRSIANGQSKARLERDTAKGLRVDKPPRGLVFLSSEDQPTVQSAERRTVYVQCRQGDVSIDALNELSQPGMIEARSGIPAALAQRVAGMMPNDTWLEQQKYEWATWLAKGYDDTDGLVVARCNTVAELAIGIRALLDLVVEAGVVPHHEAAARWHDAWTALRSTMESQFALTEGRSLSERFAGLVRTALLTGRGHLRSPEGGEPTSSEQFGWTGGSGSFERNAGGATIGWTDGGTVWIEPGTAYAVAEAEGRAQADALDVSQRALKTKLAQAHPEAFEPAVAGKAPRGCRERLSGVRRRVWALPYTWLFPEEADDDEQGANPDDAPPPLPTTPTTDTSDPSPVGSVDASTTTEPQETQQPDKVGKPSEKSVRTTKRPRPEGPRERTERQYSAAGVVVDVDGAYLINGSEQLTTPTVGTLSELMEWALSLNLGVRHAGGKKARANGVRDDAGLVVVMPKLAKKLGIPAKAPNRDKPSAPARKIVQAMTDDGWMLGKRGLAPYTQIWKLDEPGSAGRSHFAVFPHWATDPMFENLPDAASMAYRLSLYVATLGYQLVYNSGATGVGLLRQARAVTDRPLVTEVQEVPPPGHKKDCAPLEDLEWGYWREPTDDERRHATHVVGLDINASYLNAAGQTSLGYGAPNHVDKPDLEQLGKHPGYHLLNPITAAPHPLAPDLLDLHGLGRPSSPFWVTTPMLTALLEDGHQPTVRESWLYDALDEHGKATWGTHMQKWAHNIRDALYELKRDESADDPDLAAVLSSLKLTYAAGLGQLASEKYRAGGPMWLPNWNHSVKASAQVGIWRKARNTAEATGCYPVGISRDAVYYAVTSEDGTLPTHEQAMALLPTNHKGGFIDDGPDRYVIGHSKWAGSATLRDYLDAQAATDQKTRIAAMDTIWTTPKMDVRGE